VNYSQLKESKKLPNNSIYLVLFLILIIVFSSGVLRSNLIELINSFRGDKNEVAYFPFKEAGIIPLSIGNYWELKHDIIHENLSNHSFFYTGIITDSLKVKYQFAFYTVAIKNSNWLYWNGEDGLYLMGGVDIQDTLVTKILRYKYPSKPGEIWQTANIKFNQSNQKFYIEEPFTIRCVTIDSSYYTPLGTFNCVVYHFEQEFTTSSKMILDNYLFFTPDRGFIARECKENGKLKEIWTLNKQRVWKIYK
jgi:hypothetical protein